MRPVHDSVGSFVSSSCRRIWDDSRSVDDLRPRQRLSSSPVLTFNLGVSASLRDLWSDQDTGIFNISFGLDLNLLTGLRLNHFDFWMTRQDLVLEPLPSGIIAVT
jgi:hypothetical protein